MFDKEMKRKIIHIDMDAYFASVEQRDYPFLQGKPLLICHTDDVSSNRGIVTAASYEARPFGIKAGTSVLEARQKCPQGIFFQGNYDKYLHDSRLIKDICYQFSDCLEIYSIDELFLDISWLSLSKAVATAKRLQDAIAGQLKLSCSVGLGPNKLVAKMASDLNKPNGLSVVTPSDWADTFFAMPVKELTGIGSRMQRHFSNIGVSTIGQLAALDQDYLKKKFGLPGVWLHQAATGLDPNPVMQSNSVLVKSFGHSSALGAGVDDMAILEKVLLALCEGVGFRMRQQRFFSKTVMLRLGLKRMFYFTRSLTLPKATDSTRMIYNQAVRLLRKEVKIIEVYPCTLIGISACNLNPAAEGRQLSFLDNDKDSFVCQAMDKIKERYGERAVIRGALLGFRQRYKGVAKVELSEVSRGRSSFCSRWIS